MLHIQSKPIRTVLRWQSAVTVVAALAGGVAAGIHGALSALLGGGASIAAGLLFAFVTSLSKTRTAEGTLLTALRAEGAKIGAIVLLLWLVFARYREVVPAAFVGTFSVTTIIFSLAFFVRDASSRGPQG